MVVKLPPRLRSRFDVAWEMVPPGWRSILRRSRLDVSLFTRQELAELPSSILGRATYDPSSRGRMTVGLIPSLASETRAQAIAVILHELAHVVQFIDRKILRPGRDAEIEAHAMVRAWVGVHDNALARAVARENVSINRRARSWCLQPPRETEETDDGRWARAADEDPPPVEDGVGDDQPDRPAF